MRNQLTHNYSPQLYTSISYTKHKYLYTKKKPVGPIYIYIYVLFTLDF